MTTLAEPYQVKHHGLRVPWVARWAPEEAYFPLRNRVEGGTTRVAYVDQRPEDVVLDTLWMREFNDKQGEGEPKFGLVSSTRQRTCMLERRCQVCGQPIAGEMTPYVFPRWVARKERHGTKQLTATPPTCVACIPIAAKLCPVLRKGENVYYEVAYQRPAGVFGDRWIKVGERKIHDQGDAPLGAPYVLARTLIVDLIDFRKRPLPS